MEELLTVAGGIDDATRRGVDLASGNPRAHSLDRRVVRCEDQLVDCAMPRARLAKNCHSCGVRPVSVEGGTEIEQHEIARRELAAGRFRMRQGRVRTRLNERPKRKLPA